METIGSVIYNGLALFQSNRLFSDVELRLVGDKVINIPSHKVILAAHSPFFKMLFHNDVTGSKSKNLDLKIEYPEAFLDIHRFMYSGDIKIDFDNIYEVIYIADMLLMRDMVMHSCSFLNNSMTVHNSINILQTADAHSCLDLLQSVRNFISQNLVSVSTTSSFIKLSADGVYDLLNSQDFSCVDEEGVLKAALNWITFEVTERKKNAFQVLSAVRFECVSIQTFENALKELPQIHDKAFNVVISTLRHDLLTGRLFRNKRFMKKTRGKRYVLIFGGANAESLSYNMGTGSNYVYRYNTNDDSWLQLPSFTVCRYKHAAALVGNRIYLIGGNNEFFSITSSVECYNLTTGEWSEVGDMLEYRKSPQAFTLGGRVYVVSGEKGDEEHPVERYEPINNTWHSVKSPWRPSCMYNDSEASHVHNGVLYEFINVSGHGLVRVTMIQENNTNPAAGPETSAIFSQPEFPFPELPYSRYKCAMVILGEILYLIGGCSSADESKSDDAIGQSVDRLHLTKHTWDRIESMTYNRSGHVAQAISGKMYVFGGQQTRGPFYLEIYDPNTASWECRSQPSNFLYSAVVSY